MTEQDQVMKHTAGESLPPSPWYVDPDDRPNMEWNNHILSADGNTVCFMAHNPDDNTKLENAARLIASAPELLEALKPFEAAYHAYVAVMRGETGCGQTEAEQRFIAGEQRDTAREAAWDALASVTFDQLHAVHAAIAKATGEPRT